MKLVELSDTCYAHLMGNAIYLYIDNQFEEILYADDIENAEDPLPHIIHEIELSSRPSICAGLNLLN